MKYLFIMLLAVVLITPGCTNAPIGASDPIVGYWGGMIEYDMGITIATLDAYSNGTALWSLENPLIGSFAIPVKWEKNPNGTYTIFTENPFIVTISGEKMDIGSNNTLNRGFVYTRPEWWN
ncbi:MAG: hypothetical protein LUQ04_02995 [Methanoregula sp.]|nr:hypothetical protein [Methanoregula sp.]